MHETIIIIRMDLKIDLLINKQNGMKTKVFSYLLLAAFIVACGEHNHNRSIRNSEWVDCLDQLVFKDTTCMFLRESPITGNLDTINAKFTISNDTIKFIQPNEYTTIKDLIIRGDSLVTIEKGAITGYMLRKGTFDVEKEAERKEAERNRVKQQLEDIMKDEMSKEGAASSVDMDKSK